MDDTDQTRSASSSPKQNLTAQLRIVQTTDLHMHLLPYDYTRLAPAPHQGLAALEDQIADLRAEGIPTLLCDTGDFMQGNALADLAIRSGGIHPMIAAMNHLHYDAIVLGNHDFDYGVQSLRKALADLTCPVLAANVDAGDAGRLAEPYTIVPVSVSEMPSAPVLQVGLLGLTTPHIRLIGPAGDTKGVATRHPLDVARSLVPQMKAEGADIIVALCHFGIHPTDSIENVALQIAAMPDVDAVLAGHTHDVFPGPDIAAGPGIDPVAGTLHGKPAAMAGFYGRDFGVIDICLNGNETGWTIEKAATHIRQPDPTRAIRPVNPRLQAMHDATVANLKKPVAQTRVPLSTAFSLIAPDVTQQLLAEARVKALMTASQPLPDIPILGSAAPYQTAVKSDPTRVLSIPPGPLLQSDVFSIYPFRDPVIGLHQTGAQIRQWLERATGVFLRLTPGQSEQALIDPDFAPYSFTTLFGLTYQINLARPHGKRIETLCYNGRKLTETDRFIVATTPYLSEGAPMPDPEDVLAVTNETSNEGLTRYLRDLGTVDQERQSVWSFSPLPGTHATFATTASARPEPGLPHITPVGQAKEGLQSYRIAF